MTDTATRQSQFQKSAAHGGGAKKSYKDDVLYELLNELEPTDTSKAFNEDLLVELITKNPKLCSNIYPFGTAGGDTMYPLHRVCALGLSLATVKQCYKMYNQAIDAMSGIKGLSCLHYAVLYTSSSLDVIQFLIRKMAGGNGDDPETRVPLTLQTKKMQTPMHLACMCPSTFEKYNHQVVMLLTELSPKAVCLQVDMHGRTPLHIACGIINPCLEVIEDLTEVCPAACLVQCTEYKATPLHLICSNPNISDENNTIVSDVIKDLLRSNSDATKLLDVNGHIPVAVAIENNACLKNIKLLVKKYPECVEMTDARTGLNLQGLAIKHELAPETIQYLRPNK